MTLAAWIVAAWVLAFVTFALRASIAAVRFRRARERSPLARSAPIDTPALLIRPCRGDEPGLFDRLCSVASARCTSTLSVRVAVADPRDPAVEVARAACAHLRAEGLDARVVVTCAEAPNEKAAQLHRVVESEPGAAVILCADSDVDLAGLDLDQLVSPLVAPEEHRLAGLDLGDQPVSPLLAHVQKRRPRTPRTIGATWAPPVEVGANSTLGDRVSASILSGSLHAFPILGTLDPAGLTGKLFAVRRDALEAAGGFVRGVERLGEDMALAADLRRLGWSVRMAPIVARAQVEGRSLAAVIERYHRWLLVIRSQRPALLLSYPLLLAAAPLLAPIALFAGGPRGPLLAAVVILVRLLAGRSARHAAGLERVKTGTAAADLLRADLVLLAAFLGALIVRRTRWRGRVLALGPRGRLDRGQETEDALEEGADPGPHAREQRGEA